MNSGELNLIKQEINKIDNLQGLIALSDHIKHCRFLLGRTSINVGDKVFVVQKTKKTRGTVTKINIKKAIVEMENGQSWRVPFEMMEAI